MKNPNFPNGSKLVAENFQALEVKHNQSMNFVHFCGDFKNKLIYRNRLKITQWDSTSF